MRYCDPHRYDDAEPARQRALRIDSAPLTPNDPALLARHNGLQRLARYKREDLY